jgi:hypothetical protein
VNRPISGSERRLVRAGERALRADALPPFEEGLCEDDAQLFEFATLSEWAGRIFRPSGEGLSDRLQRAAGDVPRGTEDARVDELARRNLVEEVNDAPHPLHAHTGKEVEPLWVEHGEQTDQLRGVDRDPILRQRVTARIRISLSFVSMAHPDHDVGTWELNRQRTNGSGRIRMNMASGEPDLEDGVGRTTKCPRGPIALAVAVVDHNQGHDPWYARHRFIPIFISCRR